MSLSDPIANMLTIIRNASMVSKDAVDIPASKIVGNILEILKQDGYVEDFRLLKDSVQGTYKVYLKYENKKPAIIGIKRISKPGLRVYAQKDKIPRVLNGLGTAVISSSKGVITDREARRSNIGGEVICFVW